MATTPNPQSNDPDPIVVALTEIDSLQGDKKRNAIEDLQNKLIATGKYSALKKAIAKGDGGYFGKLTAAAVREHLKNNPPNEATKNLLVEKGKTALEKLDPDHPPQSRDAGIFVIQSAARALGQEIRADGYYGPKTKALLNDQGFINRIKGTESTAEKPAEKPPADKPAKTEPPAGFVPLTEPPIYLPGKTLPATTAATRLEGGPSLVAAPGPLTPLAAAIAEVTGHRPAVPAASTSGPRGLDRGIV